MRRAIARGTGLTHQLLAYLRRRAMNPESLDLAALLRGMRELLARSLRGDIEVRMELARRSLAGGDRRRRVRAGDPQRLA
jgi:hypothetical protein